MRAVVWWADGGVNEQVPASVPAFVCDRCGVRGRPDTSAESILDLCHAVITARVRSQRRQVVEHVDLLRVRNYGMVRRTYLWRR